jgi:hypothetical protein
VSVHWIGLRSSDLWPTGFVADRIVADRCGRHNNTGVRIRSEHGLKLNLWHDRGTGRPRTSTLSLKQGCSPATTNDSLSPPCKSSRMHTRQTTYNRFQEPFTFLQGLPSMQSLANTAIFVCENTWASHFLWQCWRRET